MLPIDARIYQILFLALFWLLGIGTRDWTLQPEKVGVTVLTCVVVQWLAVKIGDRISITGRAEPGDRNGQVFWFDRYLNTIPSALITALGLSLLLRADHYSTLFLASVTAILSKFLLRVQDKHVFNPANFGIIVALTLAPDAWVSPGQWGEEGWYALLFLSAGGLVLKQVGRWDTSLVFLATDAGLEAIRNVWLGWSWDVWEHRLSSGSLLLFALFMITDPRTIPNARIGRVVWAIALAILTFILRNYFFISTAAFWALFTLAPLTILLDSLYPASRFIWARSEVLTDSTISDTALIERASV
jgi:Na+-transporting NADH:ubiquinone oxidoreductase subunit NqrB